MLKWQWTWCSFTIYILSFSLSVWYIDNSHTENLLSAYCPVVCELQCGHFTLCRCMPFPFLPDRVPLEKKCIFPLFTQIFCLVRWVPLTIAIHVDTHHKHLSAYFFKLNTWSFPLLFMFGVSFSTQTTKPTRNLCLSPLHAATIHIYGIAK